MENLRILSMNLGRRFIPVKDRKKKELVTNFLNQENYDIIILQGSNIKNTLNIKKLNYKHISSFNNMTLTRKDLPLFNDCNSKVFNSSIIYIEGKPLAIINVNCKSIKDMPLVYKASELYTNNPDDIHYVSDMIIAGRFPKEIDTNKFCDLLSLDDISTIIGRKTHQDNNKEMLNHFFISRTLKCSDTHKLVGMTEISKIGEAYPIETGMAYKKIKR